MRHGVRCASAPDCRQRTTSAWKLRCHVKSPRTNEEFWRSVSCSRWYCWRFSRWEFASSKPVDCCSKSTTIIINNSNHNKLPKETELKCHQQWLQLQFVVFLLEIIIAWFFSLLLLSPDAQRLLPWRRPDCFIPDKYHSCGCATIGRLESTTVHINFVLKFESN